MIITAIVWYCKRFQKYHVKNSSDTHLQSGTLVVTDESLKAVDLELQENPSYVASLRKEVQTNNPTVDDHKEVNLTVNPSYVASLRKEVQTINPTVDDHKEVDITVNPSYTPFVNSVVEANPLHSGQEADKLLYSTIESDERNVGYDYI